MEGHIFPVKGLISPHIAMRIVILFLTTDLIKNFIVIIIIKPKNTEIYAGMSFRKQHLITGDHGSPVRIMRKCGLAGTESFREDRPHALMTRPVGRTFGSGDAGITVQNRFGDSCRKLGVYDLSVKIHSHHVI